MDIRLIRKLAILSLTVQSSPFSEKEGWVRMHLTFNSEFELPVGVRKKGVPIKMAVSDAVRTCLLQQTKWTNGSKQDFLEAPFCDYLNLFRSRKFRKEIFRKEEAGIKPRATKLWTNLMTTMSPNFYVKIAKRTPLCDYLNFFGASRAASYQKVAKIKP